MSAIAKVQAAERASAAARSAEEEANRAKSEESTKKSKEAIEAIDEPIRKRAEEAKWRAAKFFEDLANDFGEEAARAAWRLAPPKRRTGNHTNEEKRQRDTVKMMTDDTLQELGLNAEQAAGWILEHSDYGGLAKDQRSVRRTLDPHSSISANSPIAES